MPRQAEPRWNDARRRWYANIGERDEKGRRREVFAPDTLGKQDKTAAWKWFEAKKAEIEAGVVAVGPGHGATADWVCEHYLGWAEKRRDEGKLPASEYANKA